MFPRESTREVSLEVIDIRGLHDCIYYMMWFALQIVSSRKHLLLQNVTQTTTSGLFCYLSNPVSIGLKAIPYHARSFYGNGNENQFSFTFSSKPNYGPLS